LLDGGQSRALTLAGASGGSATATWTHWSPQTPSGGVLGATVGPTGDITAPAAPPADGWSPVAATRRGRRLVARLAPDQEPPRSLGAQRSEHAAVEPAPLPGPARYVLAAAPSGSALAAAAPGALGLSISVWR